jgi:hypothetical protein
VNYDSQIWNLFQSLLAQIAHEDDLIVARTGWLLASQLPLLAGYLFFKQQKLPGFTLSCDSFIATIGILSTVFIFAAILASLKVFIALRGDMYVLTGRYPELPMRALPRFGIGAGLLCPFFLSLGALFVWSLLRFYSWWSAALIAISGLFFGIYIVGAAQHVEPGSYLSWTVKFTMPAAIALSAAAVIIGVRSVRGR